MLTVKSWWDLPPKMKLQSAVIPAGILLFFVAPGVAWYWWWKWGGIIWVAKHFSPALEMGPMNTGLLGQLGVTGDLFGGINALFAAYAFAGVAIAALLQSRIYALAIRQQHVLERQFSDAHEDRAVDRERHRDQVYRERQQSLEALLFQLLTLHREHRLFDLKGGWNLETPMFPDRMVKEMAHQMVGEAWFDELSKAASGEPPPQLAAAAFDFFYELQFYKLNEEVVGPHFRTLHMLMKLIHDSKLKAADRDRYADIAKSTLAGPDLFLLMLHCVSPRGRELRALANEYGLFEHLERIDIATPSSALAVTFLALFFKETATMSAEQRQIVRDQKRTAAGATLAAALVEVAP